MWVGSAIARDLRDAGHSVVGLVRSQDKGEALAAAGGTPLVGSLRDLDVLRAGGGDADGVIHTASGLDLSKIAEFADEDRQAIEAFGAVFAGSDRPVVVTGGFGLLPVGDGQNLWPSVHRLDAARVFRLALERGARDEACHATAEEGVPYRRIAEASGGRSACRRSR